MIKPGTIVRWLRHASLVLIALPEPFTTAIGVVLLGITFYISHLLSKVIDRSLNQQAREKLANYLSHFRHFGNGTKEAAPVVAERPSEPLHVRQTGEGELKADLRSSILLGNPDSLRHHAIDHKSLAESYGSVARPVFKLTVRETESFPVPAAKILPAGAARMAARNYTAGNRAIDDRRSVYHNINREGLYRRYLTPASALPASKPVAGNIQAKNMLTPAKASLKSQPAEPAIHHAVNMPSLQKRFDPECRKAPSKVYREDFDLFGVFSSF